MQVIGKFMNNPISNSDKKRWFFRSKLQTVNSTTFLQIVSEGWAK